MAAGRFLYFLSHPSEYLGLWTLDLTAVTVMFGLVTLLVVLRQLSLMTHQDTLMQRQTDILVRQDETNREVLARRIRLVMYREVASASQVIVLCRNEGNKSTRDFYWHLAVPTSVPMNAVWDASGNTLLMPTGGETHNDEQYRHYSQLVTLPLYPTRVTPLARINVNFERLSLWWSTVSEDGSDPTPDGKMGRMNQE